MLSFSLFKFPVCVRIKTHAHKDVKIISHNFFRFFFVPQNGNYKWNFERIIAISDVVEDGWMGEDKNDKLEEREMFFRHSSYKSKSNCFSNL